MRIPYGFTLTSSGTLEINRSEANVVRMIFDFYMAGASLGKVVDMLHAKQISSPTGKAKWTRAAVDHLLSNGKYIAVIGMEKFMDAQFEKSARCNVDYDKEGTPRKGTVVQLYGTWNTELLSACNLHQFRLQGFPQKNHDSLNQQA